LVLLAAGCAAATPPPDTARLVGPAFGSNGDSAIAAINYSSWAFALASRTHGQPAAAAEAVAAVDYLAGELSTDPRWASMSPLTKVQMLQARSEVRNAIGVSPDARSQAVVNGLLSAAAALQAGNRPAALAALASPVFIRGPEQTLAALAALPYLPQANIATQHASLQAQPGDESPG
jgi:hypothetical protein